MSKSSCSKRIRSVQSLAVDSLPPISPRLCSCAVHGGQFVDQHVQDIEKFIYEEIQDLSDGFHKSRKDRFLVFKKGLEMLIEESVSFKPLLSDINAEYLELIRAVENGEHQRSYITRDLKCVVGEKGTLDNYQKQISDLRCKAEMIKANNEQLKEKIEQLRKENEELDCEMIKDKPSLNLVKGSRNLLPGLEMEELTNVQALSTALLKVKANVKATQQTLDTKFFPKEQKSLLQKELQKKGTIQHHVSRYNMVLRERLGRLNVAVEAGKAKLPSQVVKQSMFDVVLKALTDYGRIDSSRRRDPLQQLISTDEDDPLKKKESERLVAYIEHFNNLFDFGQYDAAAIHAASSPKGILRTYQAMQKFKEVEVYNGLKSPLFLFCEALMTTSLRDCDIVPDLQLSAVMSVECIACALKESGISLAIHWLNQPCIVMSLPLGNLLSTFCQCVGNCSCKCQALAEGIYRKFGAHRQVAVALTQQGKHHAVIEYGRTHGDFKLADYHKILQSNPSVYLATMLLQAQMRNTKIVSGISFCSIINILLTKSETDHKVLVSFLEHVQSTGINDLKGVKCSTKDLVFQEKPSDGMDSDKWDKVIDLCYSSGHASIAVEILSALLVRQALNHAAISSSLDYIS